MSAARLLTRHGAAHNNGEKCTFPAGESDMMGTKKRDARG